MCIHLKLFNSPGENTSQDLHNSTLLLDLQVERIKTVPLCSYFKTNAPPGTRVPFYLVLADNCLHFILSFIYKIFVLCCKHQCLIGIIQPGMVSGSAPAHFRECAVLQKLLVLQCRVPDSAVRASPSSSAAGGLPLSQANSLGYLVSEKYCRTCPHLYSTLKFFVHI